MVGMLLGYQALCLEACFVVGIVTVILQMAVMEGREDDGGQLA